MRRRRAASTALHVRALAERPEARFPTLSERGREVALGKPVPDYAIAAVTGLQIGEVREEVAGWPSLYRDDAGRIIGFWGLSLRETTHELEADDRILNTWCAWDTLVLPELLGARCDG